MNHEDTQKNIDQIVSELASLALKHPGLRSRLSQIGRALKGSIDGFEEDESIEDKTIYIPDPDFY